MTIEEIEQLATALDAFDSTEAGMRCHKNNEPPTCLSCGGEYRITNYGDDPTALDDGCAHEVVGKLARALLAVLPVVKAAVAWSESFGELSKRLPPHVHDLRRAVDEYERAITEHAEAG